MKTRKTINNFMTEKNGGHEKTEKFTSLLTSFTNFLCRLSII